MLRRHRAADRFEPAVDDVLDRASSLRRAVPHADDHVQVAVAEVAEDDAVASGPAFAQGGLDPAHVAFHVGDPQADVEREDGRQVVELLDIVAQRPDLVPLRLRLAEHGVADQAVLHAVAERLLELRGVLLLAGAERLDQHVVGVAVGNRGRRPRLRAGDQLVELAPHHLERAHRPAQLLLQLAQQGSHFREAGHGQQRAVVAAGTALQPQHDPGDDAERALGAHEQVFQVIAGVVLDHLVQAREHRAVGQHGLQAEYRIAGHAVADRPVAAGVGRHVAADRAGAAGAEVEREEQSLGFGRLLDALQRGAGLNRHRPAHRVDLLDVRHSLQGDGDFEITGDAAAHETGQPALRHHRLARAVAGRESRRELLRGAWPKHRPGRAWNGARAVAGPSPHFVANEDATIPEGVAEFGDQGGVAVGLGVVHAGSDACLLKRWGRRRIIPLRAVALAATRPAAGPAPQ